MGKHWHASDFPHIEHVKPRIRRYTVCTRPQTWVCEHKASGSSAYGYSPAHAYMRWKRNYLRRREFYIGREERARRNIYEMHRR